MTERRLAALAALAASLSVTPAGAQDSLQNRNFGRPDRLRRDSGSRLARRGRGRCRNAQRQGRHHGPQDRGRHRGQQVRAAGGGDGLSQDDLVRQGRHLPLGLRLGRQFRRRAADGSCADSDGAVLDPPSTARPREMGIQHFAAGRFRGVDAPPVSQGKNPDQEDRRAARSVALCRAAEEHRREDRGRLWPRDRRHRAIQAGRCRSQRADQQDARWWRPRRSSKSASAAPR